MSLDWNVKEVSYTPLWIKDHAEGGQKLNGVTEGLIWTLVGIGIGQITSDNLYEVRFRTLVYSQVAGKPLTEIKPYGDPHGKLVQRDFTIEELEKHIGLKTNVGATTRYRFMKDMMNRLTRDVERRLERESAEMKLSKEESKEVAS